MENTKPKKKSRFNEEAVAGLLFVLLPILGFLLFTAGPFIFSIFASFTSWDSMTDLTQIFTMDEVDRDTIRYPCKRC